ncbi:RNA polymerase recycling motor ATPase HelR [Gordonia sp. NPDC003504]
MDFRVSPPRRVPSAFALSNPDSAKAEYQLLAEDETHLAAIATHLDQTIGMLTDRIAALRRSAGGGGRRAVDRDMEIHDAEFRLRRLRRFRVDLCLGRMVHSDGSLTYIGRIGLTDNEGTQLLVDWRAPAARPFFAATLAEPMGVASRRRYRWGRGHIVDYWDEALGTDPDRRPLALDADSSFIASLEAGRTSRVRDVLGTIATDQDTIIRAGSRGALVVDGGPGTGKTVVALHRAAYLLYSDPRLGGHRGGLLVIGPHDPYLGYVADVLPDLGEEGVHTCTLRDLVPAGSETVPEADPDVRTLKSSIDPILTIDRAVRFYETPPTDPAEIDTPWGTAILGPRDWAEAFDAPDAATPHNEAREDIWEALVAIIRDLLPDGGDIPDNHLRNALAHNYDLKAAVTTVWPVIDAATLVGDLWSVPAYLRLAAPSLSSEEIGTLRRGTVDRWTISDLPFLDAARRRLGDPEFSRRRRRRERTLAADRVQMDRVVDDLLAAHSLDDGEGLTTQLRNDDLRDALVDDRTVEAAQVDPLAGPFAHIIVDEAQELTDAEWSMLLSRCPSRSFTIVGDRAQARRGFIETWTERLQRVGLIDVTVAGLTVNYRTPEEIMEAAEPVIRSAIPDANVPISIRRSGIPVRLGARRDLDEILSSWSMTHPEGTACVIGDDTATVTGDRIRALPPVDVKGLEFDLVILVDSENPGSGVTGAVDRYVAMTRATSELVILR